MDMDSNVEMGGRLGGEGDKGGKIGTRVIE